MVFLFAVPSDARSVLTLHQIQYYMRRMVRAGLIAILGIAAVLQMACGSNTPQAKPVDATVTRQNAYIKLFMDSLALQSFIGSEQLNADDSIAMLSFYRNRNYQYAWWDSSGITEQVHNFINLYRNYATITGDSSVLYGRLDSLYDAHVNDTLNVLPVDSTLADLLLTRQFFRYVERAYAGRSDLNVKELEWFIPKKQFKPEEILNNVIATGNMDSAAAALPVNSLFRNLMKAIARYQALEKNPDAAALLQFDVKTIKPGDSSAVMPALKAKLVAFGDLTAGDASMLYDSNTVEGVKHFQRRMGLTADGAIGPAVQQVLNTPIKHWEQQLLINLERARWLPVERGRKFLFVNIPSYTLYVFDSSKVQFTMGVVVGTAAHNTTIFSGTLKHVVLAPYWNVPYSIVKNEMGRTASYFSKRNMEIVGRYNDGLPMVRQKPGASNSLGRVKFLFPNSYNIYLHDTPSKGLFSQTDRAFSHGCIRLSDPKKLAYYFLDGYKGWTVEKIDATMNGSKETYVNIDEEVPVLIAYLTAWVDPANGDINFRKDLYGHDKKMASRLFGSQEK